MTYKKTFKPENKDSAFSMGSGTLEVLATPAVVAFAENTCHESIMHVLKEGTTTVGTFVELSHLKATNIEESVVVEVTINEQTDKFFVFTFEVMAADKVIAKGLHKRAIIDTERFLNKLK